MFQLLTGRVFELPNKLVIQARDSSDFVQRVRPTRGHVQRASLAPGHAAVWARRGEVFPKVILARRPGARARAVLAFGAGAGWQGIGRVERGYRRDLKSEHN